MIAALLRLLALVWQAHQLWPDAPLDRVVRASYVAVAAETHGVPAEILLGIAQHESDLTPNAVSYKTKRHPQRVDILWTNQEIPQRIVCGYLQAMASPTSCRAMIDTDGGMRAGAAELEEWLRTCRGDVRCALRGHAGGTACAIGGRCSPAAATFARHFYSQARRLGWRQEGPSS